MSEAAPFSSTNGEPLLLARDLHKSYSIGRRTLEVLRGSCTPAGISTLTSVATDLPFRSKIFSETFLV